MRYLLRGFHALTAFDHLPLPQAGLVVYLLCVGAAVTLVFLAMVVLLVCI